MMKQFSYRHTKEAELMDSMEQAAKGAPQTDEELFSFAGFNEAEVERTGYSNYSYWSSTFRAFLKNKGRLFFSFSCSFFWPLPSFSPIFRASMTQT